MNQGGGQRGPAIDKRSMWVRRKPQPDEEPQTAIRAAYKARASAADGGGDDSGPRSASPRSASPRSASPRSASPRSASPRSASPRSANPRVTAPRSAPSSAQTSAEELTKLERQPTLQSLPAHLWADDPDEHEQRTTPERTAPSEHEAHLAEQEQRPTDHDDEAPHSPQADSSGRQRTQIQLQRSTWLSTPLTALPAFDMPAPPPSEQPHAQARRQRATTPQHSHDAARRQRATTPQHGDDAPLTPPQRASSAKPQAPVLGKDHTLQLLWHEPGCISHLRSISRWRRWLGGSSEYSVRHTDNAEDATAREARHIHQLLAYADSADGQQMRDAVNGAVSDSRGYQPPLMLIDATVGMTFNCTSELRTYLGLVQDMTPTPNRELAGIIKRAHALVSAGSKHSALTAEVLSDLRRVFARAHRHLPQGYLAREVEHRLLVERDYTVRKVLGKRHLRADVALRSGSQVMVGYLPAELANVLPMEAQLRARMVVEAHPRQDGYEQSLVALKALAVGWVCLRPRV